VPWSADDPDIQTAWRCIPIRPSDDDAWFIIEDRDYKTVWGRWHEAEGNA
jgi:hypothetical protein